MNRRQLSLFFTLGALVYGCEESLPPLPSVMCTPACASGEVCVDGKCEVAAALAIDTDMLPLGKIDEAYLALIEVSGGQPPYVFSLSSGMLPEGLALSAEGEISGLPTVAGSTTFEVTVTDGASTSVSKELFIGIKPVVGDVLTITTDALPEATIDAPYAATFAADNGTPPLVWSVASGNLPAGLLLAADGTIMGTPTAAGAATFAVQVTDGGMPRQVAVTTFTLVVNPAMGDPLVILTSSLAAGRVDDPYGAALEATGGVEPYSWSLAAGTSLPSGLALSETGTISGTPTQAGTITFSVVVVDAGTPSQQATAELTIRIGDTPIEIVTPSLPDGEIGVVYSATVAAMGGATPYAFSVSNGAMPPGLQLEASGVITGVPISAGSFSFTVQVTDGGMPAQVATRSYSIAILAGPGPDPLTILTSALPGGTVGSTYAASLAAMGGTPPYAWTLDAGTTLPPGLALAQDGTITGMPTTAGTYAFTVTLVDAGMPQQTASAGFTIVVSDVNGGITIVTANLPAGLVNAPYAQTLMASGGTAPYTWQVVGGQLPPGITLDAAGALQGMPTTAGAFVFTVEVSDAAMVPATAQATFTLTINAPPGQGLTITTARVPAATVGAAYQVQLQAAGGVQPYAWSVAFGVLPDGLVLGTDGLLSGTASVAGSFSFTVEVTDSATTAASAQRAYTMTAIANPSAGISLLNGTLPSARVGRRYRARLNAAGGTQPYTYSIVAGALPMGMTLDAGGLITGTSSTTGTYDFTVRVVDSATPADSTQRRYALSVLTTPGPGTVAVVTSRLQRGRVGRPYRARLMAAGGTRPYTWLVAQGALPDGLTLAPDGSLSGTPTRPGAFVFVVQVTDNSMPANVGQRQLGIEVR